ncbi:MAG: hypothetical protein WBD40_09670 [Tepidisphaeraceae bacterium]
MKSLLRGFAFGALCIAPVATYAQDAAVVVEEKTVVVEEPAGPNAGSLALTGGLDFTTAYFFRGYLQEDQGLIAQPYLNLYFDISDSEANPITGYVGMWNSFHEEKTGADDGSFGAWYESDLYAGVDAGLGGGFTLGAIYTIYTYPNGAFDSIEEIGFKLSYDDTDKWGLPFALRPYAAVYFETKDNNGSEDTYLEIGIAPTVYTFNEEGDAPIAIAVPVTVGMSLDDYYFDDSGDDEFLGYFSVGVAASMPLPIPSSYGAWSLNGSVTWLQLLADGLETANNDDSTEIIGKLGVSFAY